MAKFLTKSEYMEHAPTVSGEQVHVNHNGCSAGSDSKRRLYIKRLDTKTVVAFCHHCGKRGSSRKFLITRKEKEEKETPIWKLPKDYTATYSDFPPPAREWIGKYISRNLALKHKIGYSEKFRRVILPVWRNGELSIYQARKIYDDDPRPKYLTYKNDTSASLLLQNGGKDVIIVEDMLSAIVLHEYGYDSIALFGTSCSDKVVDEILRCGYSGVIVMLDDNNIDVKKQALRIQSSLNVYVPPVLVAKTGGRDPKSMSLTDVKKCILEATL